MNHRYAWGAALALSLAANAYLLVTRPRADAAGSKNQVRLPRAPTIEDIPLPDFAPAPAVSPANSYLGIDRATLEQRLARAEARINQLRDSSEKFAALARAPEVEARVKPYLDEVFAQYDVKEPKYAFECHGRVCKIESAEVDDAKWMEPLQGTYPTRAIFQRMSFGRDGTFVELHEPEDIPAPFLRGIGIATAFAAQKACSLTAAPKGDIAVSIAYDAPTRTIRGTVGGSLAAQPVGVCVKKTLDEQIERVAVPPEMKGSLQAPEMHIALPLQLSE